MPKKGFSARTWRVVIACTIGMLVTGNPISFATASLFLQPITQEFGWTRSTFFGAASISVLAGALCLPLVGLAVDRWGVRRVLLPGVILYGLGTASLSLLNGSITQYMLLTVTVGMLAMQSPLLYSRAVVQVADTNRGLALAVAMTGSAIGMVVVPLVCSYLIGAYGWRGAKFGLGLAVIIVALPPALLLLRNLEPRPDAAARRRQAKAPIGPHVRTVLFWLLAAVFFCSAFGLNGLLGHMAAVARSKGLSLTTAAAVLSCVGIGQAFARFAAGYLLDRFDTPQVGQVWIAVAVGGLALFWAGGETTALMAAALLAGATLGAEVELLAFYVSRFFPAETFGRLYGIIFACFMAGVSSGPFTFALLYDPTGGYGPSFALSIVVFAIGAVALACVGPYRFDRPSRAKPATEASNAPIPEAAS